MATYVRQSSFSDGDTITAALFNNEFNQLVNAFSVTGGHTHDGSTTGDGGPISNLFSNALVFGTNTNNDIAITFNATSNDGVLTWMEDEDYFKFSDDLLIDSTEKVQFRDTGLYIYSSADGQLDIVADTEVQIAATTIDMNGNADISGNLGIGGNLTVTGTTTFNGGTITMGDAATDNVVFGADVDSNIIPDDDDSYDLGSSTQEWKDLYIDGVAYLDAINFNGTAITATAAELNILDGVTSTAAELNILDGVTSTAAELNILDGVTSTAAELNILDGVTSTTAELNILDGVTASAADINLIDGVTNGTVIASKAIITDANKDITGGRNITISGELDAGSLDVSGNVDVDGTLETDALSINGTTVTSTAAELNILDGVTATAAEINALDGITSTVAELNILDGVTSTAAELNLLDGKAFLDEDNMASNSATGIASQQSIKAYVDTQITAEDLDITTDSGTIAIDLDSETLTVSGGTGLDSSATGNAVTLAIDSTVATLTGSQTLTNKSLTAPTLTGTAVVASLDISGDIDVDGTTNLDVVDIDGAVDMASTLTIGGVLTANAGAVFNENSADVDFRVESNDNANMLFVNGGDNRVGIGHSAPEAVLDIVGNSDSVPALKIGPNNSFGFKFFDSSTNGDLIIKREVSGTDTEVLRLARSSGAATFTGAITANAGVVVDNFTLDGTTLALSSGDLTLDVANNIFLDADGGVINLKDGGTSYGQLIKSSNDFRIFNPISDGDIVFRGNDGGSAITALTLDMSAAGAATFNTSVLLSGTGGLTTTGGNNLTISGSVADHAGLIFATQAILPAEEGAEASGNVIDIGASGNEFKSLYLNTSIINDSGFTIDSGGDIILDADGGKVRFKDAGTDIGFVSFSNTDLTFYSSVQDRDLIFQGNDGGSAITALTLDMSAGGSASFSHDIQMVDNGLLRMGAGGDLILTSDGTNGSIFANEGNLTLDAAGDIIFDADGTDIILKDDGTAFGLFANSSTDFIIRSTASDRDLLLQGNDNNTTITALTLDMSAAGAATFNAGATLGGNLTLSNASSPSINLTDTTNNVNLVLYSQNSNSHIGTTSNHSLIIDVNNSAVLTLDSSNNATFAGKVATGAGLRLFTDGSNNGVIQTLGPDKDMFFSGDDNGSGINALVLDMSAEGAATFNSTISTTGITAQTGGTSGIADVVSFNASGNGGSGRGTGILIKAPGSSSTVHVATIAGLQETAASTANNASLAFQVAASNGTLTERMRLNSSGNLILGTATVAAANAAADDFVIKGTGTAVGLTISQDSDSGTGTIFFGDASSSAAGGIRYNHNTGDMAISAEDDISLQAGAGDAVVVNDSGADVDFRVESNVNANTIFMEGSSGVVNFGRGSSSINTNGMYVLNGEIISSMPASTNTYLLRNTATTAYTFYVSSAGQIHAVQTSISSLSDERLKENIKDIDTGLSEVMALKPRKFDWKEGEGSNEKNVTGFVAQEVETVLPDLIGDFEHDDLNDAKSVKMGDMIPTLVKAIQEQQELITTLQAEVALLKEK